ncbi:nucleotide sugar dehydrogenase [Candidatus Pelagibacter sp.]|nr:nucleotide sugar dehydrogenase [Candidatus Pelagibacter sp.]
MVRKIGFVGLGKLGLPVSLAIEAKGYKVIGFDISPSIKKILLEKKYPYQEKYVNNLLKKTKLEVHTLEKTILETDIVFLAVQTPHNKKYEGITRIPNTRKDFDYNYLISSIKNIIKIIKKHKKKKIYLSIISTVLPKTFDEKILPLIKPYRKNISISYNPFFIAMGTVIDDFLNSEFILFGSDDFKSSQKFKKFYSTLNSSHFFSTTIQNAELIKVLYNTFISTKLAFINNAMEICSKIPNTNIDVITNALSLGNKRIISNMYLKGGMGDGGSCHPRDNIALSYLSNKLKNKFNFFDLIMKQRESSTEWLAELIKKHSKNKTIIILGRAFKANTNMTDGSPGILLINLLKEKKINCYSWDPYVDKIKYKEFLRKNNIVKNKKIYFIATAHTDFINFTFENECKVIDPWGMIKKNQVKNLISIGRDINNENIF